MKIIDSFMFYNEYKMLLLRLTELYDVVDQFIIVEATSTYVGNKKELNFKSNLEMYKKFLDKVTYIVVNDMPNTENPWDNENYQRACIDKGIQKLELNDEDIIVVSDCDEIPNSELLNKIKNGNIIIDKDILYGLNMDFYYYNYTCKQDILWNKGKLLTYNKYKSSLLNDEIKKLEYIRKSNSDKLIQNGGWHLSFFGDKNFIVNKIKNFAHQEHNNDKCINDIDTNVNNNKCIFDRRQLKNIKIENNYNLPKNYKILI